MPPSKKPANNFCMPVQVNFDFQCLFHQYQFYGGGKNEMTADELVRRIEFPPVPGIPTSRAPPEEKYIRLKLSSKTLASTVAPPQ